ncbi:hypothetical protein M140OLGA_1532 [Staphylococcus aureus subsp. aureus 112808A]|nr:hypothetical protein M140OLGA_1532 [Staphylococcus aureus subsp. aureus 112808A]
MYYFLLGIMVFRRSFYVLPLLKNGRTN